LSTSLPAALRKYSVCVCMRVCACVCVCERVREGEIACPPLCQQR